MTFITWGKRAEKTRMAEKLLAECCQELDLPQKKLAKDAKEWLVRREWDESGREMRQAIWTAALLASGDEICAALFPPRSNRDHEAFCRTHFYEMSFEEIVAQKMAHFFQRVGSHEVTGVHRAVMDHVERPLILQTLEWTGGNQQKTARVLGVHRNTLRKRMRELGIKK